MLSRSLLLMNRRNLISLKNQRVMMLSDSAVSTATKAGSTFGQRLSAFGAGFAIRYDRRRRFFSNFQLFLTHKNISSKCSCSDFLTPHTHTHKISHLLASKLKKSFSTSHNTLTHSHTAPDAVTISFTRPLRSPRRN